MIDVAQLNKDLTVLIDKKSALNGLSYDNEQYDVLEETVHAAEDAFLSAYGPYLEEAFHEVHDEYCSDNEVLLPIAYIPNAIITFDDGGCQAVAGQGVYIEADDYDSSETKLVLLPNPVRIELLIGAERREVVWQMS